MVGGPQTGGGGAVPSIPGRLWAASRQVVLPDSPSPPWLHIRKTKEVKKKPINVQCLDGTTSYFSSCLQHLTQCLAHNEDVFVE